MGASEQADVFAMLPDPGAARTVEELVEALRALRVWAGNPSHEAIRKRVNAAWTAAGRPQKGLTRRDAAQREGLGKSRGGWTTKIHTIGEGRGRNLTTHLTPGQVADTRQLVRLLDAVAVALPGGIGRPRKRLDSLVSARSQGSTSH